MGNCQSCGMPMTQPEDYGGGQTTNPYCKYCTDDQGKLLPKDEVREKMIQFQRQNLDKTQEQAETDVDKQMALMPAWKIGGAVVTDQPVMPPKPTPQPIVEPTSKPPVPRPVVPPMIKPAPKPEPFESAGGLKPVTPSMVKPIAKPVPMEGIMKPRPSGPTVVPSREPSGVPSEPPVKPPPPPVKPTFTPPVSKSKPEPFKSEKFSVEPSGGPTKVEPLVGSDEPGEEMPSGIE